MNKIKTFQGRQHETVADAVNTWLEANPNIDLLGTSITASEGISGTPYITIMIIYKEI